MKDGLCGPRENPCPAPGPPGCCPLTPLCVAGVWRSPEQVAAGQEAGVRMPFPVRRVPVLLHHDGVQRVHLRELAHVRGTLIYRPPTEAQFLLFCAIQDPAAPRVTRAPRAGLPSLPCCSQASAPASVAQALPAPSLAPPPPPGVLPATQPFLPTPSCLLSVKTFQIST